MSSANELSNNQGPTPAERDTSRNANSHPPNTQDPRYYYKDGSTVFSVDGVLFKFQGSLVFGPRSTYNPSETAGGHIVVRRFSPPNITASQFRNFLLVVLGLPSDPEYLALLTDAQNKAKHSRDLLVRYLDISFVARRFGMSELEGWARSQLCLVLESMYVLALGEWDKETLLRLDSYARSTNKAELTSSVTTFIQYFVSTSVNSWAASQQPIPSNLNTCVQLYNDPNLPKDNPAVFGCVFTSILSLGHRSTVWMSLMSNKDKAVLYAAQVQLAPAAAELNRVGWLQPTIYSTPSLTRYMCGRCQSQLQALWEKTFGRCGGLNSDVILRDVTSLALLPQHRYLLASEWDASLDCSTLPPIPAPNPNANSSLGRNRSNRESIFRATVFRGQGESFEQYMNTSNAPMGSNRRHSLVVDARETLERVPQVPERSRPPITDERKCLRLEHPLAEIDRRTQQVYQELAGRQRDFMSHIQNIGRVQILDSLLD